MLVELLPVYSTFALLGMVLGGGLVILMNIAEMSQVLLTYIFVAYQDVPYINPDIPRLLVGLPNPDPFL